MREDALSKAANWPDKHTQTEFKKENDDTDDSLRGQGIEHVELSKTGEEDAKRFKGLN